MPFWLQVTLAISAVLVAPVLTLLGVFPTLRATAKRAREDADREDARVEKTARLAFESYVRPGVGWPQR